MFALRLLVFALVLHASNANEPLPTRRVKTSHCSAPNSAAVCYRNVNCNDHTTVNMTKFKSSSEDLSRCALVVITTKHERQPRVEFQTPSDVPIQVSMRDGWKLTFHPLNGSVTCAPLCTVIDDHRASRSRKKQDNEGLYYRSVIVELSTSSGENDNLPDAQSAQERDQSHSSASEGIGVGQIIIYCAIGGLVLLVVAIILIALVQRRARKRAGRIRELASKGTKRSGSCSGAALAHRLSAERAPIVGSPKAPTPGPATPTPKPADHSSTTSLMSAAGIEATQATHTSPSVPSHSQSNSSKREPSST